MPDHRRRRAADARRLGLADRPHAPRAVARSLPPVGRDVDRLAVDLDRALPEAGLREAVAVEHHAAVGAHEVLRLLERGDRARPREVERERVLRRLADRRAPGAAARSTSTRNGPTVVSMRSPSSFDARSTRCFPFEQTHANASCVARLGY